MRAFGIPIDSNFCSSYPCLLLLPPSVSVTSTNANTELSSFSPKFFANLSSQTKHRLLSHFRPISHCANSGSTFLDDDDDYHDNDTDDDGYYSYVGEEEEEVSEDSVSEDGVFIEIKKLQKNSRRIRSKISINASLDTVWKILTDYEKLADFIPSLAVSKLIDKKDNFARLYQIGQQNLAFGLKFNAKAILDCYERDLQTFTSGKKRDIEFKMTEGDFQCFEGKWSIEQVIRLSAATQDYPNSIICNVHGVNPKFLEIGKKKIELQQSGNGNQAFTKGAYYIGKMVWSKGYKELIKLLQDNQKELIGLEVDLYGSGEDSDQVQAAAKKLDLVVRVYPGRDHADPVFHDYKVFLNPSTTDVVCTTTAEALAMGKIVVCANHPSNEFFKQFVNCWTYDNSKGFVEATSRALTEEPAELTGAQRHELSWEAATERFLRVADLDQVFARKPAKSLLKNFASTSLNTRMEDVSAYLHYVALGSETSRRAFGAIPGSLQPDEELCKELGLAIPAATQGSKDPVDTS